MLLKSLHYSIGQPIILPSGLAVNQAPAQRPATTPCSDVHTDDDVDDVNAAVSGECWSVEYYDRNRSRSANLRQLGWPMLNEVKTFGAKSW